MASATDMLRFLTAVAEDRGPTFLSRKMTDVMLELPPRPIQPNPKGFHVGLGWDAVRRTPEGIRFGKNGGKPGVQAWLEHLPGDLDWAVMFNNSPAPRDVPKPMRVLRNRVPGLLASIGEWPREDLFAPA